MLELAGLTAYVVGENLDLWRHLAAERPGQHYLCGSPATQGEGEGGILEENQQLSHWLHIFSAFLLSLLGLLVE